MFRTAGWLLAVALIHACLGCQSRSEHIHYTLPDGYRGAVLIYTEQPDGVTLNKKEGRYLCVIPETGILRLKGKGPFYQWHSTTASFANGDPIPIAHEPEQLGEDTVAFWGCGSRPGGLVYDFIGTKAEHQRFGKERATGDVKPGGVRH